MQPFIDILSEAKIYEQPTKENICIKTSKIVIIKMPSFSIKEMLAGMGTFWNKVDSSMLDSVKSITDPTPDRIVNAMNVIEGSQTDQRSQHGCIISFDHQQRTCSSNLFGLLLAHRTSYLVISLK